MTIRKTTDELLDGRQLRRMKEEDRFLDRLARREAAADRLIGELVRDGRTVHYVYPAGGKYREGARWELTDYLLRNRYA